VEEEGALVWVWELQLITKRGLSAGSAANNSAANLKKDFHPSSWLPEFLYGALILSVSEEMGEFYESEV
jgi:hypothetical protein